MPFQSGDICPAGGADIRGGHAFSAAVRDCRFSLSRAHVRTNAARARTCRGGVVSEYLNTADPILEREPPSSALADAKPSLAALGRPLPAHSRHSANGGSPPFRDVPGGGDRRARHHGLGWPSLQFDEPQDDVALALAGPAHGPHALDHSRLDLDEALAPDRAAWATVLNLKPRRGHLRALRRRHCRRFRAQGRRRAVPSGPERADGAVRADAASGKDAPHRVRPPGGGEPRAARSGQAGEFQLPGLHAYLRTHPARRLPASAAVATRPDARQAA